MKGELKCAKHRAYLEQLSAVKEKFGLTEADLQRIVLDGGSASQPPKTATAPSAVIPTAGATIKTTTTIATTLGSTTDVLKRKALMTSPVSRPTEALMPSPTGKSRYGTEATESASFWHGFAGLY
jgi:hypothetical protein